MPRIDSVQDVLDRLPAPRRQDDVRAREDVLTSLLKATARINREHAATARDERRAFNVFTLLRPPEDEVHLHSRFLYELLNPQGTHGMGARFLALFLDQVGCSGLDLAAVSVEREHQNVDLLVADGRRALIIENKIHAADRPGQLLRYYRAARAEGFEDVTLLYLTLYGDDPGPESVGDLERERVVTASYQNDVRDWLDACIAATEPHPIVRGTLVQYQRLVEDLTGQTLGRKLMDVKALLQDEEHLAAAITLSRALTLAQIEIQFGFWLALEEKLLAAGYDVTEYWKYSRRQVEAYYQKGVRRYGLLVTLPELLGQEIVAFFIGVSHRLYYGFVPLEGGSPVGVTRQPGFAVLSEILRDRDAGWSASASMIGQRPARRTLDFHSFNSPDTLALVDAGKRDAYLDDLLDEIAAAIAAFYAACEDDPRLATSPAW